ncbi:MAG: hypothetical protein MR019_01880 [Ruminococcus sp.]|nr:hypothetical protein [Ruminococcus sp.]MDY3895478.1 hypothetical protein [Candidatus Fimenecus sp.]
MWKNAKKTVAEAICGGYQKAFDEHKQFWTEFWQKSSVELPDKLLEKGWYINNYLLGSCSRKHHFPMPLQGVRRTFNKRRNVGRKNRADADNRNGGL